MTNNYLIMSKEVKYGFISAMLLLTSYTIYKKLNYDYFIKNGIKSEVHTVYNKKVDNYESFFYTADSKKIYTNKPLNSKKRVAELRGHFPKWVYYISQEETEYIHYPESFLFDYWFKRLFIFGFFTHFIFVIVFSFQKKRAKKNSLQNGSGAIKKEKHWADVIIFGLYFCSLAYLLL